MLYESWWIELFAVAEAEQQSQSLDVGKMPSKQEDSESLLCCLNLYMFSVCMCFCSCQFCYSNNKRIFGHGLQFHATVRLYYAYTIVFTLITIELQCNRSTHTLFMRITKCARLQYLHLPEIIIVAMIQQAAKTRIAIFGFVFSR